MPRRNNNKRGVITIKGNSRVSFTFSASNVASFNLHPTTVGASRIDTISDAYMHYRFSRLHFTWLATDLSADQVCLAYTPSLVNTAPTTLADVCQMTCANLQFIGQTVPASLVVPTRVLRDSEPKWLRTRVSGSVDDLFEYQGTVYMASSSSESATVSAFLRYEIQFSDPVPISTTLDRKDVSLRHSLVEEKEFPITEVNSWSDECEPRPKRPPSVTSRRTGGVQPKG